MPAPDLSQSSLRKWVIAVTLILKKPPENGRIAVGFEIAD
jgi:hypothetical protein